MTTRTADAEGFVTDDSVAYYTARAAGDVALIIVEMAAPERVGKHRHFELGISDDRFLPGLQKLVEAIHHAGAKAGIQLGHGGGHTRIDVCGATPIAPSAIAHIVQEGSTETVIPQQMSIERIGQTVQAFADAAQRAQRAGFDLVEIHAAHGYLLSQFLAPLENRRTDQYGGCIKNRARFALQVLRAVKAATPRLAVTFRMNGDDYFDGGLSFDEARQVAIWAAQAGAHAIHMTGGHYRSQPSAAIMIPPMATPATPFVHYAAQVRECVDIPVIAVGRLGRPVHAIDTIESGHADFVALGRPLLADPQWVRKAASGRALRLCLACNTCVDGMREGDRLHCLVNPVTGRERQFANLGPRLKGQRIAVIGAGPAGLTYAATVAQYNTGNEVSAANNTVIVYEKNEIAGGALRYAGYAPMFQNVEAEQRSLDRYLDELVRECEQAGVQFHYGWDLAKRGQDLASFDHIIVATGAFYTGGMNGVINRLLKAGIFRAPLVRRIAQHPRLRTWFYGKARKPGFHALAGRLPANVPVTVIGDARVSAKSDAAIRDALFAAHSLQP